MLATTLPRKVVEFHKLDKGDDVELYTLNRDACLRKNTESTE